jgi:hypothetical protein
VWNVGLSKAGRFEKKSKKKAAVYSFGEKLQPFRIRGSVGFLGLICPWKWRE